MSEIQNKCKYNCILLNLSYGFFTLLCMVPPIKVLASSSGSDAVLAACSVCGVRDSSPKELQARGLNFIDTHCRRDG